MMQFRARLKVGDRTIAEWIENDRGSTNTERSSASSYIRDNVWESKATLQSQEEFMIEEERSIVCVIALSCL